MKKTNEPTVLLTPISTLTKHLSNTPESILPLSSPLSITPTSTEADNFAELPPNKIALLLAGVNSDATSNCKVVLLGNNQKLNSEADLDALFCNSISWSPEGQQLVYSAYKDISDVSNLFLINIYTGKLKRLSSFIIPAIDVVWSPNENYITYVEDAENADIVNLKLSDGSFQKLTHTSGLESNPVWSPDGKQIAFIYREDRASPGYLWIMDANGSNRKQTFEMQVAVSQFSWSPDGKKLVFSSPQKCGGLYVFDIFENSIEPISINAQMCKSNPLWLKDNSIIFIGKNYIGDAATLRNWGVFRVSVIDFDVRQIWEGQEGFPLFLAVSPVPSLEVGREYLITAAGANLNVRQTASLSAQIILKLNENDKIKVLDGPIESDGYYWWRIELPNKETGWIADVYGWFDPLRQ
ncbi:MAG: SH3 domain-containing protein [Chloroflexota bacterium]|nr:PD40 domain-containing protein [Chloroflexota bacterium]MBI5702486.1 PD40 domain-containing protein [Chloroflexota bacterium]